MTREKRRAKRRLRQKHGALEAGAAPTKATGPEKMQEHEEDSIWEAIRQALGPLLFNKVWSPPGTASEEPETAPKSRPSRPTPIPMDPTGLHELPNLSERLARSAREAGFDPAHFERGARSALMEIERAAAGRYGDEAHKYAVAGLNGLEPHNGSHEAGIDFVRSAMTGGRLS